jgi:hypothetical protein
VLDRVAGLKQTGSGRWISRCPRRDRNIITVRRKSITMHAGGFRVLGDCSSIVRKHAALNASLQVRMELQTGVTTAALVYFDVQR